MNALPMAASGAMSRAWYALPWTALRNSVMRSRATSTPASGPVATASTLLSQAFGERDDATAELELDEETVHLHHCRGPWSRDHLEEFLVKVAA